MAVTLNASTSTGYIQTADTSGSLALQSNGTTQLTVSSTGAYGQLKASTAVASTSGTSIDFTGLPSWVKRITVMFQGVSTNGSSILLVQLGTGSTTFTTSGYLGAVNSANSITNQTTGFGVVGQGAAANVIHGSMVITNVTGNAWCSAGTIYLSNTALGGGGAGSVSLAAALTAVRITTVNGTDTFDAGTINILYEG